ncbi:Sensor protein ZraS [Pelotomaculum sp. FP]|uniref:GAF domain-containing sensor histidine kinase n=1 Tax=Pelotomaculum sp. FP TaxID=261474 RepID=UPI0010653360|nr:sensor histidine kinase [Pelotomaculum sp. FP]TEB17207.1 Sensor protein ZraS [Pelotomaculum sp. FP]
MVLDSETPAINKDKIQTSAEVKDVIKEPSRPNTSICCDLEQCKDVIEELTRQNTRMAIIQQIAKRINIEMSYEDIIDEVAEPLRGVLPYDLLSFCLIENDKLIIKSGVPKGQIILDVGWVLDSDNSAPWKAITDKHCFLRQDIWNDTHKYQEDDDLRKLGIKSAIMAPLLVNNEVIGALNFGSKETYVYSENDFIFVQQMADQLAVCINNSRLYGEVLKSKREWEETFKAVPDRLFLIDRSYNVLRSNSQDFMKKEDGDFKCYKAFTCIGEQCQLCPTVEAFRMGKASVGEFTHTVTKNIYNISAYPVYNEKNELYGMTVYVHDVTNKRKMEAQLFQSAKLAAIGEMAAGVAHELNSPLTAIIGNTGLILRNASLGDKHIKLLEDIKSCGQRSKRIIQNLLTFSRQDSYSFAQVSINNIVETSLYLVSYQIEKNKITIKKNLNPRIPPIIGNKQQLEQVVINFLLNARDALEGLVDGRIEISTDMREDAEAGCTVVETQVADNGKGIPESIIDQIFNPFFTTKEKTRGTGLGLSVSLGIAQTHGGRIEVSSEVDRGSVFSLIIPV